MVTSDAKGEAEVFAGGEKSIGIGSKYTGITMHG